jgi:hypothetical protein
MLGSKDEKAILTKTRSIEKLKEKAVSLKN